MRPYTLLSFKKTLALFYSLAACSFSPAIAEQRTIIFPSDKCYGQVVLVRKIKQERPLNRLDAIEPADPTVASAQGKVVVNVPDHSYLGFEGNRNVYSNPQILGKISPRGLEVLKVRFNSMESAEDGLCDNLVKYISHFSDLKILKFKGADLSDGGFVTLGALPELISLDLSNTTITSRSLRHLKYYPRLKTLAISNINLQKSDLRELLALPRLEILRAHNSGLSNEVFSTLSQLKNLQELDLSNNFKLNGRNLALLKRLNHLRSLDLGQTAVSGDSLMVLKGSSLRKIEMSRDHLDDKTTAKLQKAMPHTFFERTKITSRRQNAPVTHEERAIFAPLR